MALYKEIATDVDRMDRIGHNNQQIALILDASERTVRRARQWLRQLNETPTEKEQFETPGDVGIDPVEDVVVEVKRDVPDDRRYTVMASESSITINFGDESETVTSSHEKFDLISDIVWESRGSQKALAEAFEMMSYKQQFIKMTDGLVEVDSAKNVVLYDGCPIAPALQNRIIEACQEDDKQMLTNLVEFTKKLHENPSRRAVMELYSFLEASDILIRDDGLVECYKRVRDDYMDFYTGLTRNKPGDEPQMHRWQVDEDKTRTCSAGYHVCAKSYLPAYHIGQGRIVKCLVHPADFVAIPVDYNFAKARVWRYKVISEVHTM